MDIVLSKKGYKCANLRFRMYNKSYFKFVLWCCEMFELSGIQYLLYTRKRYHLIQTLIPDSTKKKFRNQT